jgi:hypothetical protein
LTDLIIGKHCSLPEDKLTHTPAKCKRSDILKNILINCGNLPFKVEMVHILAHQDDIEELNNLSRPAQLNCAVDAGTK